MWKPLTALAVAVTFALAQAPIPAPFDPWVAAAADLKTVAPTERYCIRYFLIGGEQKTERAVLAGHLRCLSPEADLVVPTVVPGSGGALLRISIHDYGWKPDLWEKLAEVEPFFHQDIAIAEPGEEYEEIEKVWPGGPDANGNVYPKGYRYRVKKERSRIKRAVAAWVADTPARQVAVKYLIEQTQTQIPLVRADWFVNQTAINFDRRAGYYQWLGIKNRDDFDDLVGFNVKVAKKARFTEMLEAVARSGVSKEPRRIEASAALGGRRWKTLDQVNKAGVAERNPLDVPDDSFVHDAEEGYGLKADGWWAVIANAANGDLQDSAPDGVGYNHFAAGNDGKIHASVVVCAMCHYNKAKAGTAGLIDLDAHFRGLQIEGFPLQSTDPDKAKLLRQQYASDIVGPMEDDRNRHRRAVLATTGMEADRWAAAYIDYWRAYEDAAVTPARAAADLGITEVDLKARFRAYLAKTGALKPSLARLMVGKDLGIRQWESVYGEAQLIIRGLVPVQPVQRKAG